MAQNAADGDLVLDAAADGPERDATDATPARGASVTSPPRKRPPSSSRHLLDSL